MGQIIK